MENQTVYFATEFVQRFEQLIKDHKGLIKSIELAVDDFAFLIDTSQKFKENGYFFKDGSACIHEYNSGWKIFLPLKEN